MRRPLILSILFHLAILGLALIGMPYMQPELEVSAPVVAVDIVTVGERTNPPPAAKPKSKPDVKPAPKKSAPPEPAKPKADSIKKPQSQAAAAPKPKSEPKAEAEPAPKDTKAKEEKLKQTPQRPKQQPKQEQLAKQEKKEEIPSSSFDSVLKTVAALKAEQSEPSDQAKPTEPERTAPPPDSAAEDRAASTSADPSLPVTITEIDLVRRQIERCWSLPAGAKEADSLIVAIKVEMNRDGTPRSAMVDDQSRMRTDPFFRAAAESALRAVLNPRCHPFTLPAEKYDRWKTLTLVFNPQEMFGT